MTMSINSSFSAIAQPIRSLSPKEQTAAEIAAIKNDPRLQEKIGNSTYEIKKMDQEMPVSYLIVTDWCTLQVDVRYLPPEEQICGPARFELEFHDALEKFPHITEN